MNDLNGLCVFSTVQFMHVLQMLERNWKLFHCKRASVFIMHEFNVLHWISMVNSSNTLGRVSVVTVLPVFLHNL